ncbi:MAG: TetR/AcrR family transcriptional regulator [Cetobacterium sp.]|uniref:TetR/AcrR family transcriptional regulator n=1 Tax=Cetobacterium sp. TaxID=2071632 RepID=UPI003F3E2F1B
MKVSEKKERILKSAKKLILENGFKKTSIEDITNDVGIAKGSFYTVYSCKNDLLAEILQENIEQRKNTYEKLLSKATSFEEAIKYYVEARFDFIKEHKSLENTLVLVNLQRNIESLGENVKQLLVEFECYNRKIFIDILEEYNLNINMEDKERYASFVNGGIKAIRMEKIFYKNNIDFFISDGKEVLEKLKNIDINIEINKISELIKYMII